MIPGRQVLFPVLSILVMSGCVSTTSILRFDLKLNDCIGKPGLQVVYRGTKQGYHYLDISCDGSRAPYRISALRLKVLESFPLNAQEIPVHWLTIEGGYRDFLQIAWNHQWVLEPIGGADVYALRLLAKPAPEP